MTIKVPVKKGLDSPLNSVQSAAFLRANSEAYKSLIKKIQKIDIRKEMESVLNQVAFVAQFATLFHPGRFADGAIENLVLEIGRMLEDLSEKEAFELPTSRNGKYRRILHVASKVQGIGGLERMLHHWICNDQSSCHSLVLLNQEDITVPKWLSEAIRRRKGYLLVLPQSASRCLKAQMLREAARRYADLVVLHHYPDDPVPIVAFAVQECPPVAIVNHSDHTFWLGSSVADVVINMRTISIKYTAERRFVSSNIILPIPLIDSAKKVSRQEAREILGIPKDQIVLISIGRAEKYKPRGSYDFVKTVGMILRRQPTAHLYVVGESKVGISPYLRCEIHDRLHFVGIKEDPSLYRIAADIYLETFPFGTQTSLLEAGLEELPVVPAYAPLFPLLVANDDALQNILSNPIDEYGYIELAESLIKEPEQRIMYGKKLRKCLLVDHVGEGWLNRLDAIYQKTECLIHNPRSIPISQCIMTDEDIALSMWHVITDNASNISGDNDPALLWHICRLSEYYGDYLKAGWFGIRAMLLDPRGSWRVFAKLRSKITHSFQRKNI